MCGFAGVLGPSGAAGAEDVEAMARTLVHRGPDDFGTWHHRFAIDGRPFELGLGHTRLAILDLSPAGHQPMTSADGRVTVAYNGEIYNFRALRRELEALGHAFRSQCDTEVLIEAYRAWGDAALPRLSGMFAFALWDDARGRLLLVRDRLGIKPLYYRFVDGVLSFASELSALRAHRAFRGDVDPLALGGYLRHGYVCGPRTIYRDSWRLMPGHVLVWEQGDVRTTRYWSLGEAPKEPPPQRFEQVVDALEDLLGDAVEERLVADVPLGAFLSGGVDSSTVVALMKRRATGTVLTFSIGFRDGEYDEAPHARAVARHLGTEHTELYVESQQALEVAHELPDLYDEPFADPSAIPTVLLSRLTREHVTVALSGDGGDELFGGYWQYGKLQRLAPWLRLPQGLRTFIAAAGSLLPSGSLRNGLLHLRSADAAEMGHRLVSGCDDAALAAVLGPGPALPNPVYLEAFHALPEGESVRRAMYADAHVYLPDDILTKVDRASMSVGLEARVPILDYRVARFAFALPLEVLWRGGRTKAPLRALLHRHVPPPLIERPKHGFAIPIAGLLGPRLAEWRDRYLDPRRLREEGLLVPEGVTSLLADARRRDRAQGETLLLWRLLCFERWFARHHRGEATC
jgi:asparagine synthase (glutamine-hydrolysing)